MAAAQDARRIPSSAGIPFRDAFCAGMLYAFLKGMPADEGMRLASCAAAMNLAATDSVSGARSLEETLSLESRFTRGN